MITRNTIVQAQQRIAGRVHLTPLEHQYTLSEALGAPLYVKLENLQKTGSFKLRGALNKLGQLTPEQRAAGVVAASAGNHAQGVAWAARELGMRALIVMPEGAAASKVAATKAYGAEVLLKGETFDDAAQVAAEAAAEQGLTLIPAFDDEAIIAGQGTIGLEILEQLPDVGTVVVPVGGGGLISGIAIAIKEARPEVRVIGVEAEGADAFSQSLASPNGQPVTLKSVNTIADGIALKAPGRLTYPIVRQYVDDIVVVRDDEIAGVILLFMERLKLVVEGAGAASVAALLSGRVAPSGDKPTVAVVSGGNIDVDVIARIIERGLVRTGRRMQLRVNLPDRPGALHRFSGVIARSQANILGIEHDRTSVRVPIGTTEVILSIAVHDAAHGERVIANLTEAGYEVTSDWDPSQRSMFGPSWNLGTTSFPRTAAPQS